MDTRKKLNSLSDLEQFLTESDRQQLADRKSSNKTRHDGKGKTVRVYLDMKGRKGKAVTIVSGLQHNPTTKEDIARILKQHCGAGGTVKDGNIEIQGDQRVKVMEKLREMNYVVR
jgi:predicted translation initiation factor SUI1